jgi:hypothetical protein
VSSFFFIECYYNLVKNWLKIDTYLSLKKKRVKQARNGAEKNATMLSLQAMVVAQATSEQLQVFSTHITNDFIGHTLFMELYLNDMLSASHIDYLSFTDLVFLALFGNETRVTNYKFDGNTLDDFLHVFTCDIDTLKREIANRQPTDVIHKMIQDNPDTTFKYIHVDKQTPEMCLVAVEANGFNLDYIPATHQTQTLCDVAVAEHPAAFRSVAHEYQTHAMIFNVLDSYEYLVSYVCPRRVVECGLEDIAAYYNRV